MALTEEQLTQYRAAAQRRQQQRCDRCQQRHQLGLVVAQQASKLLKHSFGATQVVLFGSMHSSDRVHERSDVDLAVWGLSPDVYFRAVGELQALDSRIAVDLVEAESAPPRLLQEIAANGVVL